MTSLLDMTKSKLKMDCDMSTWFPAIKDIDVPMPKTEIIYVDREDEAELTLSEVPPSRLISKYAERIKQAVKKLNLSYPIFLRTGQLAAKHSYERTCYIASEEDIESHLLNMLEVSAIVDFMPLPVTCFVVREFIEPDWKFKAFSGRLPIAPERRYFIRGRDILCHHPYWPEDAIAEHFPIRRVNGRFMREEPENWRELLKEINTETEEEVKLLSGYAKKIGEAIAKAFPDTAWSVDFVRAKDGRWYFIDMARAELSWHPKGCENAKMTIKQ